MNEKKSKEESENNDKIKAEDKNKTINKSKNKIKIEAQNKKIKIIRIIILILIIAWTLLVFCFSNQNGDKSSNVSVGVVKVFTDKENLINLIEPYVRKLAHYAEYCIGGILFILLFNTYNWKIERKVTISVLLGLWYSIMDEIHQLLIPGRDGNIADVWIDTLGVATGVVFILIILKIINICKNKEKVIKND